MRRILVIGVLLAVLTTCLFLQMRFRTTEREKTLLEETLLKTSRELERLKSIYRLSIEFEVNPLIVECIGELTRKALTKNSEHHRLIPTPQVYTYLMLSLIRMESGGDPTAVGDQGKALGLTQIWLSTARQYRKDVQPGDLLEIETNLEISVEHFESLLRKYRGNVFLAILAWNRGGGTVDRLLSTGKSPANSYLQKIIMTALEENAKGGQP